MIDVFGSTGFIGSRYCEMYPKVNKVGREDRESSSSDILYFLSTNTNYNVYRDVHLDIDTNLNILMDVLSNCGETKPTFNFISSWFVYGDTTTLPAKESDQCNPKGFYSITKKCAEDLLISYCKTFGIPYRILRLSNVYGLQDLKYSKEKNALMFLISKMIVHEDIGLYHGGQFIREYTHVDDICRAINLIINSGPVDEIYNVGCGEQHLFRNLIGHARKRLNSKSKIQSISPSEFHDIVQVKDMYMDTTKLKALGFSPKIGIYDGINSLCDGMKF